ncbi:MAG: hypothetical protein WC881_08020, partial [Elusimicrobiota bacterium]
MRIILITVIFAILPLASQAQSEASRTFVNSLGRSYSSALSAFRSGQPVPESRLPEYPSQNPSYSWFFDNVTKMRAVQAGRENSESPEAFHARIRQVAQTVNMDPQAAIRLYGLRVNTQTQTAALAERHLRASRLGQEQSDLPAKLAKAQNAFGAHKGSDSLPEAAAGAPAAPPARGRDIKDLPPRVQPGHLRFMEVPPLTPAPAPAAAPRRSAMLDWKSPLAIIRSWFSSGQSDKEPQAASAGSSVSQPLAKPAALAPIPAISSLSLLPTLSGKEAGRMPRPKRFKNWSTLSAWMDWSRAEKLAAAAKQSATVGFTGKCYRYVKKALRMLYPSLDIWGSSACRFAKDNPQVLKQLKLYKVNPAILPGGVPPMGAL